jgi:two-component system sensor histidine kinase RegB
MTARSGPLGSHVSGWEVPSRVDPAWLARIRWAFVVGEGLVIASWIAREPATPWPWLLTALAGHALSNVALSLAGRVHDDGLLGALLLDVVALSTLLALGDGASSPFSVVLLVQVTVAAVTLSGPRLWAVVAIAVLAYASLFLFDDGAHVHGAGSAFSSHLEQMWVAFTLTAIGIAAAVSRLARALEHERRRADSNARVMGMTTLAAGAAHELATPLATIKMVVAEIDRELAEHDDLGHVREDLALVRAEVVRSRAILDQLSVAAGELRGEHPSSVALAQLAQVLDALPAALRARVSWRVDQEAQVALPVHAIGQALQALVRNALEASTGPVEVRAWTEPDEVLLRVTDRGVGMSQETLARVGEPFFTTKDPGRGMGLGIFLVRALAAHLGGEVEIDSVLGRGTSVTIRLPRLDTAAGTPTSSDDPARRAAP